MQTGVRPRFLAACLGEATDVTPVWFMRQAGRSFPEYRELREKHSMLQLCHTPELAVEVTLQPVRRLGVDAAILFSDIVVVLEAMGVSLDIVAGLGPVIDDPIRTAKDLDRLRPIDAATDLGYVMETIEALKADLTVPLIGFAGAPFTLASYLVEGGPSKSRARTKALMYSEPQTWNKLMDLLSQATLSYLAAQIDAGADAIQLFDSWVGDLAPGDYERSVASHVTKLFRGLEKAGVPRIYFGVGTGELLSLMAATGPEVMGLDWRVPLSEARKRIGGSTVLQGNLDPAACVAEFDVTARRATEVLSEGGGKRHIFNLGHGVLPETDPGNLARLVDHVHAWRPRD